MITHHALDLIQDAFGMQQTDSVASNQTTKRVANKTQLLDLAAFSLDELQLLLDLEAHTLTAEFDAIISEGSAVALGGCDPELVGWVPVTQRLGDLSQVRWVSPELQFRRRASVGRTREVTPQVPTAGCLQRSHVDGSLTPSI